MFSKGEKDTRDTTPKGINKSKIRDSQSKMQFLDNLFEGDSTTDSRSYIKLSDDAEYNRIFLEGKNNFNDGQLDNPNNGNYNTPIDDDSQTSPFTDSPQRSVFSRGDLNRIFGLKTWIGLFLSFILLCYVFDFKLIIVAPLLFIVFSISSVLSLGTKYFSRYIKRIRSYVRAQVRRIKGKEQKYDNEYRLMEI